MSVTRPSIRRALTTTAGRAAVVAAAGVTAAAVSLTGASGAAARASAPSNGASTFSFKLELSPGIASCLPNAGGDVTITRNNQNDIMKVTVHGLAPSTTFALFVIQEPLAPFGLAWYQTDIDTNSSGSGNATVQGVFNRETFSVSKGGPSATFTPAHLFHLGLWFDAVKLPFDLGCEPGATKPVQTPFDGDHNAGPQALNTAQFPLDAGPLSNVPD